MEMDSHSDFENDSTIARAESRRQRSARRLRHEAQVKVFEGQAGGLEDIRKRLGLRPSQLCEILKVHPSAWTRWTRTGKAPPHVFQMLDWYLELLKWRGQNQALPVVESRVPVLAQEDPKNYVPAPQTETQTKTETDAAALSGFSPTMTRFLIVMWLAQTLLAGAIILLVLKRT